MSDREEHRFGLDTGGLCSFCGTTAAECSILKEPEAKSELSEDRAVELCADDVADALISAGVVGVES